MNKEFVPYDEALALKKLGFDEPCVAEYFHKILTFYYNTKRSVEIESKWVEETLKQATFTNSIPNHFDKEKACSAPTYSQVFKWFRNTHQLFHEIGIDQTTYPKYAFDITRFIGNPNDLTEREWGWEPIPADKNWCLYREYEEAELACLKKLIELIKK